MYLCGMKLPVNTTYAARATAPAGSAFTPPEFNSLIINSFSFFCKNEKLSLYTPGLCTPHSPGVPFHNVYYY